MEMSSRSPYKTGGNDCLKIGDGGGTRIFPRKEEGSSIQGEGSNRVNHFQTMYLVDSKQASLIRSSKLFFFGHRFMNYWH